MTLRRTLMHGLLLVLVTALLAACSTGSAGRAGTNTGTGGDTSKDPQQAALSYAKCMRENGVDIPDPKPAGSGDDKGNVVLGPGSGQDPAFKAAMKACAKYAKDMGGPGLDAGFGEDDKQRMLKLSECMRDQGYDMPDPDFSGGNGTVTLPVPSDAQGRAKFEKAHEACRKQWTS
jgi:hypothetical protein